MEDNKMTTETKLAVIETNIEYIKNAIAELTDKISKIDFDKENSKQNDRISHLEKELAILHSKIKSLTWVLGIVGSTAIAALTTAILRLILKG